jgi:hypothetical protein
MRGLSSKFLPENGHANKIQECLYSSPILGFCEFGINQLEYDI